MIRFVERHATGLLAGCSAACIADWGVDVKVLLAPALAALAIRCAVIACRKISA